MGPVPVSLPRRDRASGTSRVLESTFWRADAPLPREELGDVTDERTDEGEKMARELPDAIVDASEGQGSAQVGPDETDSSVP